MCTYEDLVAATLPHGLSPLVVPQLKTITLGGAVSGLGIESASFRNGMPHESVLELDILTGAGEIVTASADQHADLYRAFPNSYGTLGYAVRLRIALEAVQPFVALRHVRYHALTDLVEAMNGIVETGSLDGVRVDYLDGVVFSADESYLCLGLQTAEPGPVSDYTGQDIYYRSIQHDHGILADRLTIADYLWRWDTDWFWCSAAFGAQHPLLRRCWPKRYRRSSFYWKLLALRAPVRPGRPVREGSRAAHPRTCRAGHRGADRAVHGVPGLVPGATSRSSRSGCVQSGSTRRWSLYPMPPGRTYVNLGFWSTVPSGTEEGETNRAIEQKVRELDGHKSLYSDAYYTPEEFDELYGGAQYRIVKQAYDPDSRLLDLYAKAVQRR